MFQDVNLWAKRFNFSGESPIRLSERDEEIENPLWWFIISERDRGEPGMIPDGNVGYGVKGERGRQPGQGIIEYAGALVMATLIVASILAFGVDGMVEIFNTVIETVQALLIDVLNSLA